MPSRLVCVAILVYWSVATWGLVHRDLLPELTVGGPPDLRTISSAGENAAPARWSVQVIDNPVAPSERRSVGEAVTESKPDNRGGIVMTSKVWFDSGLLLKGTPLSNRADERIEFVSTYLVDASGNLRSFHAGVRSASDPAELLQIEGRLEQRVMKVRSHGPLPFLNRSLTFDYQDRGVVGSQFGPLDRLPGLQVGQRWDERLANPLSGKVETVRAHVRGKEVIYWNNGEVVTLVVVHQSPGLSARTWVRPDGVVLRQEVPFPLLRLVLERQPDRATAPSDAERTRVR